MGEVINERNGTVSWAGAEVESRGALDRWADGEKMPGGAVTGGAHHTSAARFPGDPARYLYHDPSTGGRVDTGTGLAASGAGFHEPGGGKVSGVTFAESLLPTA